MDAAEALKHQRRREHQSAYFQRLSSQIWVVVLYTHLDDLGNITEAERAKLRELFQEAGIRPVLRETHFFISQDTEIKNQGGVQHVLRFIFEYLQSRGRWAPVGQCASCGIERREDAAAAEAHETDINICSACRGVACIFDQTDLSVFDKHDMDYYQGNGAPARGVIFRWIKAFRTVPRSSSCATCFCISCPWCARYFLSASSGTGFVRAIASACATQKVGH
jgi:hypothetical protein